MEGWRYTLVIDGEPAPSSFHSEEPLNEGSTFIFQGREMIVTAVNEARFEGTTATISARPARAREL